MTGALTRQLAPRIGAALVALTLLGAATFGELHASSHADEAGAASHCSTCIAVKLLPANLVEGSVEIGFVPAIELPPSAPIAETRSSIRTASAARAPPALAS